MPNRTVGRYRLTKQLGVGMFSKVMLGIDDESNTHYAVKVMRKDSLEDMDMARYARREAAVLRKLSHPNIVAFVEAIQSDTKLFLVMQIAPGSELLDIVATGPLREPDAKIYMRQLVGAVAYLHSKGIVHRDLKPDNILVDEHSRTLKIIDFGLTGVIRKNAVMRTSCGSSYYSAPEVTYSNGDGYDGTKADAWSMGILSYILLTGSHPFVDADGDLMTAMMRQGIVEYPDYLSRGAIHFISRLLAIDARKRYSVAQVSLHPWLTGKPVPTSTGTLPGSITGGLHHQPELRDRPKKESQDSSRAAAKRPGTFTGANHHKTLFGRTHSDRNNHSSPSLAMRRRSSHKHSSGSFLWFRKQAGGSHDAGDRVEDEMTESVVAAASTGGSRRGSLDRPKLMREGRITIDIINGRAHHEPSDATAPPRVRRQLSLSTRTKALLLRGSLSSAADT